MADDSSTLLKLPAELIDHILSYLTPYDVLRVAATCALLKKHSLHDPLWRSFIHENVALPITSPGPAESYRDLYLRHHPHWFLTRNQLWFSDSAMHGKLIFTRYDPRRACIEGYTVVAQRGPYEPGILTLHNQVVYDTFRPNVKLDLNQPVLRLDLQEPGSNPSFSRETVMQIHSGNTRRISSVFLLTRPLADDVKAQHYAGMWPPAIVPSPNDQRTRNQSPSGFNSAGHKPDSRSQLSDATFRIRQWVEFGHFMPITPLLEQPNSRVGEVVHTYGTISKEAYTPTTEKPWQGIWCGDFGGHGCEFLLVTQPENPGALPEKAQRAFDMGPDVGATHNSFGLMGMISSDDDDAEEDEEDDESALYGGGSNTGAHASCPSQTRRRTPPRHTGPSPHDKAPFKGRIEAVKLTGDPNVPRGEYTFIAPDIGANGLVGHASEPVFAANPRASTSTSTNSSGAGAGSPTHTHNKPPISYSAGASQLDLRGARIVRGVGHIAGTGFRNDTYIPTQLIMISENRLAQYWLPFRHVSFFERVDLAKLAGPL